MAAAPFQITLQADGFEDKTVTLDRESEKVIRVPMQPLMAGKAEANAGAGKAEPTADAAAADKRATPK